MTENTSTKPSAGLQFSASDFVLNCSTLLTELPINERPAAARAAGFTEIEFWWPFDGTPVPTNQEVDAFIQAIQDAGVRLVGLNFWAGTMADGDRGRVSTVGESSAFAESCAVTADIGKRTGCSAFNALYGLRQPDVAVEEQQALAVQNLVTAAQAVAPIGGTVLLEPVSGTENYPLQSAADALDVINDVRSGGNETSSVQNIALLADFYHLAVNGDDVGQVIENHSDEIGHIQIADNPGRGAPGTGDLPLFDWLARVRALGYTGKVGLEYKQDTATAFDWLIRR